MPQILLLPNQTLLSMISGVTIAFLGNPFGLKSRPAGRPLWTLINSERNLIGLDQAIPEGIKQDFWKVYQYKNGNLFVRSDRSEKFMDQHEIFGDEAVRKRWKSVNETLIYDLSP